MNFLSGIRSRLSTKTALIVGVLAGLVAAIVVTPTVDGEAFAEAARQAADQPAGVIGALVAFGLAFVLRAIAWQRVLPDLPFSHALAGIHLALGANHVLPFRLGEPLRVLSVVRRRRVGIEAATVSTVTLRSADMVAVIALGAVVAPSAFFGLVGLAGWLLLALVGVAAVVGWKWLSNVARRRPDVVMPGLVALSLSAVAWVTVAVAAQIAAIAPGGFGTYEAAAVAAYAVLGYDPELALIAALGAHALKTAYSLVVGVIAAFLPAPALTGRFRLNKTSHTMVARPITADAPVVLFMPAYNEEEAVEACIERVPQQVHGRRVELIVVDDGSYDSTAKRAEASGAEVIRLGDNQGLGAAVRVGLKIGVERGAAAVVFCDADGEYPPEELHNVVAPIFDGEADYVIGSRFLGRIDHMRPHRRFGNHVLTRVLQVVARQRITDGQSGYRALSFDAAHSAEIIHDFNYAQVLTLDLLAKGFRYREVPISYHFRTTGESFIKLGRYLRNVVPAVYREINAA